MMISRKNLETLKGDLTVAIANLMDKNGLKTLTLLTDEQAETVALLALGLGASFSYGRAEHVEPDDVQQVSLGDLRPR